MGIKKPINLLVTGATGFLGSRLIEHLVEVDQAYNIIATGRKFTLNNKVLSNSVNYFLGDLSDSSFVQSLFKNDIDVVINCASLSAPWGTKDAFYLANITTQKNLIDESLKFHINRFIYISSPSIYFNFKNSLGIKEEDPLPKKMVNNYARTKYQAELLLKKSGLSYVILRPRALIGRGDTVIMPRLIRSHMEGRLKIMGTGNNQVDLTSVSNMTEAIRLAIETSNYNEAYNISNGEPINLWDSINEILLAIGLNGIESKLSYPFLYSVATAMELQAKLLKSKSEPILTRYSVGVLAKSFTFNISKAQEKLNYHPKQTTSAAIAEFAKWYKEMKNDKSFV